jgi:hypothetical protein
MCFTIKAIREFKTYCYIFIRTIDVIFNAGKEMRRVLFKRITPVIYFTGDIPKKRKKLHVKIMVKRGEIECDFTKIIQADVVLLVLSAASCHQSTLTFAAAAAVKDNRQSSVCRYTYRTRACS